jgi:hypothetical protein
LSQSLSQTAQEHIAFVMTEGVVDVLEAIQIYE